MIRKERGGGRVRGKQWGWGGGEESVSSVTFAEDFANVLYE